MNSKTAVKPILVRLKVATTDIKNGWMDSSSKCPVALALRRRGFTRVSVREEYAMAVKDSHKLRCDLPREVIDFIAAFDDNYVVYPFEFNPTFYAEPLCNAKKPAKKRNLRP